MDLYICGVVGFIITGLLIWITEYYTGTNYRPVDSCSNSTTGHGTNVIGRISMKQLQCHTYVGGYCFNELAGCMALLSR